MYSGLLNFYLGGLLFAVVAVVAVVVVFLCRLECVFLKFSVLCLLDDKVDETWA